MEVLIVVDMSALRKLDDKKRLLNFNLYVSTYARLEAICAKEGVKVTHLMRQLVNSFIDDYTTKGGKKS